MLLTPPLIKGGKWGRLKAHDNGSSGLWGAVEAFISAHVFVVAPTHYKCKAHLKEYATMELYRAPIRERLIRIENAKDLLETFAKDDGATILEIVEWGTKNVRHVTACGHDYLGGIWFHTITSEHSLEVS